MANSPLCSECGAPLKTDDQQCWLCYRSLVEENGEAKRSAQSAPASRPASPLVTYQSNPWAIVGLVLAALAMIPAAGIAFLVTCTAMFIAAEGKGQAAGIAILPVSIGAAVVVLAVFGVLIGMFSRQITRPVFRSP